MEYKRNYAQAVERLRIFWARELNDGILAKMNVPNPELKRYLSSDRRIGEVGYPPVEDRIRFWDAHLQVQRDVEDDAVPVAYMTQFDEGLYGAVLGGHIQFLRDPDTGWISSMCPPFLRNLHEIETLSYSEKHPWIQEMQRVYRRMAEYAHERFGMSKVITIDGLNFVVEARGAAQAYLDLQGHPDRVRRLMDFALDYNTWLGDLQDAILDEYYDSAFSYFLGWVPNRALPISVDAYHMCQPSVYREIGEEYIEQLVAHFGGGVLHLHANGRQLLPYVKRMKGLLGCMMGNDRGFEPAYALIGTFRQEAGELPLIVNAPWEWFQTELDRRGLPTGVFYLVDDVPSVEVANRTMEKVRRYRP